MYGCLSAPSIVRTKPSYEFCASGPPSWTLPSTNASCQPEKPDNRYENTWVKAASTWGLSVASQLVLGRQQTLPVNRRNQRIGTRKRGIRSQPRGLSPHSQGVSFPTKERTQHAEFNGMWRIQAKAATAAAVKINGYEISNAQNMAPRHGFEPRLTAPKAAVLPLDDRGVSSDRQRDCLNSTILPHLYHSA